MLGLVCSDLLRMHLWMLFLLLFLLLTSFSVDLGRRLHEVLYLCGTYIGCPLVEMLSRASSRNLLWHHHQILLLLLLLKVLLA